MSSSLWITIMTAFPLLVDILCHSKIFSYNWGYSLGMKSFPSLMRFLARLSFQIFLYFIHSYTGNIKVKQIIILNTILLSAFITILCCTSFLQLYVFHMISHIATGIFYRIQLMSDNAPHFLFSCHCHSLKLFKSFPC